MWVCVCIYTYNKCKRATYGDMNVFKLYSNIHIHNA